MFSATKPKVMMYCSDLGTLTQNALTTNGVFYDNLKKILNGTVLSFAPLAMEVKNNRMLVAHLWTPTQATSNPPSNALRVVI